MYVRFAFTAVLLFVLYRRIEFAQFRAAAAGLKWWPLALFFPICVANKICTSLRWRELLKADGIVLPFWKLFASYWVGSFFNIFMPSNIGGDVYRIADVAKRSDKPVGTTVSVFADRLAGFVVMSFMGVLFPLLGLEMIPPAMHWVLYLSAGVFTCFIAAAVVVQSEFFIGVCLRFLPRKFREKANATAQTARSSFRSYLNKPAVLAKCLGLSCLFQTGMVVAIWSVGESLGLGIAPFAYFVFVPIINLLESVPWTMYGMGARDAGYTMFFTAVGCVENPAAAAAVMSLVYVTLSLAYASAGGIIFALRRLKS